MAGRQAAREGKGASRNITATAEKVTGKGKPKEDREERKREV